MKQKYRWLFGALALIASASILFGCKPNVPPLHNEDYTITYNLNGGSDNGGNPASYNIETETITLKPASRTGYTFKGWFNNEKCTGDAVTQIVKGSTGNKKFWAKWEANKYKVHFDGNGADGETMNDQTFTYDKEQALMANTFTKTGYAFTNWATNKDGSGTTYSDKQQVKNLTAKQNDTVTLYA